MKRELIICVTGAAGKIAYSLYNIMCSSDVFGTNIEMELRLLEIPNKVEQLKTIKLEIQDCCYQRVKRVLTFTTQQQPFAFKDADVVIFLGSKPREPGMDRCQVFDNNAQIFEEHGKILDQHAKKTCRSLVVSNPPNTNCLVLARNASSIPRQNFTSLTRLDYNRFLNKTAEIFETKTTAIKNIFIWGNHSKNHFCDINMVEVEGLSKQQIRQKTANFDSREVERKLHERGGYIAETMGSGTYLSASKSIIDHLRDWFLYKDKVISMGVILPKQIYGIPEGLCFSVPCYCLGDGNYRIIENLNLNQAQLTRIKQSREELKKERSLVEKHLNDTEQH